MDQQPTDFPRSPASQRRCLFETWEERRDVATACRKAQVCRETFYNWPPGFAAASYAGLEACASSAPQAPHQTPAAVAARVAALRRQHPNWGKPRLAAELAQAHNWVPVVAPNTVRRLLRAAERWPAAAVAPLPAGPQSRPAAEPGQPVNVALCFVPASHALACKLPAVSGSSGRLVIEAPGDPAARPSYPGRIFADAARSYTAAMQAFVAACRRAAAERAAQGGAPAAVPPPAPGTPPAAASAAASAALPGRLAGTSPPPAGCRAAPGEPPAATPGAAAPCARPRPSYERRAAKPARAASKRLRPGRTYASSGTRRGGPAAPCQPWRGSNSESPRTRRLRLGAPAANHAATNATRGRRKMNSGGNNAKAGGRRWRSSPL